MTSAIKDFLQDFQDMYVDKEILLDIENQNMSKIELKHLEKYLNRINSEITELTSLTHSASKEAKTHYLNLLSILEDKIDFIGDSADVYNYVNSYFDLRTVRGLKNFDLREAKSDTCLFDYNQKGITLKSTSTLFKCSKTISGSSITFYNTNSCYHSGLHITSPFLKLLELSQIVIRRADGTILELDIKTVDDKEYYIDHENLQSSQIIINFNVLGSDETVTEYLNSVELNLIDYTYNTEGYIPLGVSSLDASDLFTIIVEQNLKNNTYVNLNLGVELLDINNNVLDNINTTIAINNTVVCKRLDRINFNEVEKIVSLIIKNKQTKSTLTQEYLESLEFKNEKYVLYIPKNLKEDSLNRYLKKLGQSAFKVNTKVVKKVIFSPTLELFSFQEKSSPLIKHVTGVTKNETI